ncbi:MAG: hypothetical protein WCD81_05050 [Candidatus Bathyarchaeia archaeon]
MRLLKDNKGQMRVIEAFFASILLFSILTLVPAPRNAGDTSDQTLISMGQNALMTLDNNGYLSRLIENQSWITLRECIQSAFPPTVWFNLTVFDENNTALNNIPISSGSPVNEEIVSLDYVCVSQSPNYSIYLIRLQLAVVS